MPRAMTPNRRIVPYCFTKQKVWTTRDGRQMLPQEMDNDHIVSVLRMLLRSNSLRMRMMAEALGAFRYASTAPDGASMAAEQAGNEFLDSSVESRLDYLTSIAPLARRMVSILQLRKIDVVARIKGN